MTSTIHSGNCRGGATVGSGVGIFPSRIAQCICRQCPGSKGVDEDDHVTIIPEPQPTDILCGKDKTYNKFSGNVIFHKVIEEHTEEYIACGNSKNSKMTMTKRIVALLQTHYRARFIKPVQQVPGSSSSAMKVSSASLESQQWYEISDLLARDKVSHALRFAASRRGLVTTRACRTRRGNSFSYPPEVASEARSSSSINKATEKKACKDSLTKPEAHKVSYENKYDSIFDFDDMDDYIEQQQERASPDASFESSSSSNMSSSGSSGHDHDRPTAGDDDDDDIVSEGNLAYQRQQRILLQELQDDVAQFEKNKFDEHESMVAKRFARLQAELDKINARYQQTTVTRTTTVSGSIVGEETTWTPPPPEKPVAMISSSSLTNENESDFQPSTASYTGYSEKVLPRQEGSYLIQDSPPNFYNIVGEFLPQKPSKALLRRETTIEILDKVFLGGSAGDELHALFDNELSGEPTIGCASFVVPL